MKLRALRLHGFKSFADRTEIVFHDGITAVVGPNGCGKSNISDAVRWVLGEQRPTAIRGAKMEEAIFQGTVSRRPVNRGAVTMEVTNEDGALPVAFQEVEISRTVFRDGGSEYALNRSPCRLKDIQELCRDTGLGANAYAVIEGRMIDAILSDRAEERRGLFEEAAGIGKYKDRRRAAARRLERAELDLQRLEDLIGEVQTKVRSLARQKGRAERYRELRKRRLDVEVALARGRLEALDARLTEVRAALEGDHVKDEGLRAGIGAAEGRVESLKLDRLEAERSRIAAAARLDEVKNELVRWERELAVAEERATYAERRLVRMEEERAEATARIAESEEGEQELGNRREELREALEELDARIEEQAGRTAEVREELVAMREGVAEVEGREREVARRVAQLQGDAEAARSSGKELEGRIGHLERELQDSQDALGEIRSQGDLFSSRVSSLSDELDAARSRLEEARSAVEDVRKVLEEAREEEMREQDRHGTLSARRSALERMERDREGVDPAVQAVLSDPPAGVVGILADFLETDAEITPVVEAVLGVLLRAVVVKDAEAARRLARWFREEWESGGGLMVLPLDRVPPGTGKGGLLDRVSPAGEGAPWVRALLDGIELAGPDESDFTGVGDPAGIRAAADGGWVERRGVVRLGNPLGSTGLLERKERLRALEGEVEAAAERADAARLGREKAGARLSELESRVTELQAAVREVEDAHREVSAEEAARSDRFRRMERTVEELEAQLEATRTAKERAEGRADEAHRERESLLEEEEELRVRRSEARERLDGVQEDWETVKAKESELNVERTRLEGEMTRAEERLRDLSRARQSAAGRLEALEREREQLEEEQKAIAALREEGREEMESLFERRTEAESELEEKDRALQGLEERLAEAEKEVREARATEREATERRHTLELEEQELTGKVGSIRERLEGEWGRPLERLVEDAEPVEAEEEELVTELKEIVVGVERIGPVNMLAVEEHEEESARLTFLTEQRDDLLEARDDLKAAIREINQTATRLFSETFEAIRENFRSTFQHLFEGGEADLWLEDADDPLESDIEIRASPRGKRTQRIDLLSGGERALTALSLLFGIYLVKPSPFCVLDEVDAPLDEANIGRFIRLLQQFKEKTQFVVITHNPRTIEAADWIYGVTMEEPGVSTIVGVRLDEALETAGV